MNTSLGASYSPFLKRMVVKNHDPLKDQIKPPRPHLYSYSHQPWLKHSQSQVCGRPVYVFQCVIDNANVCIKTEYLFVENYGVPLHRKFNFTRTGETISFLFSLLMNVWTKITLCKQLGNVISNYMQNTVN